MPSLPPSFLPALLALAFLTPPAATQSAADLAWAPSGLAVRDRDPSPRDPHRDVRVAIGSSGYQVRAGAEGGWVLKDAWGRVHARGTAAPAWAIERRNLRLRVSFDGSDRVTAWSEEPFTLSPEGGATLSWNGRRYRGSIAFVPTDSAIVVVNAVDLESYLRGVVPLELGVRSPKESSALEAQAIAARSYTVVREREGQRARFDLTSVAVDQVYGGMDAEHPLADAAILATEGLVLTYQGDVIRAPYHSTCGGRTVPPSEAWSGERDVPYLRGIRDTPDGSDQAWCEISPRFHWERTLDRRDLDAAVARYVSANAGGTLVNAGGVRGARIERMTPSGRVATLALATDGGTMRLSGTALRTTLRSARGEIVNSTYFSLEPVVGRDGRLMQLTLRGTGNGHGVGMCQWGAIARARAGHDARAILAAYFPGTVVARLS
ncbi:MAG: SpoIID/LytB domain-containing protein [Gemmatimonadota bacterium]